MNQLVINKDINNSITIDSKASTESKEHINNNADSQTKLTQNQLAWKDIKSALKIWRLWGFLGWNDIRMRYRGSVLGPFWITASMLIFICAFSIVYSKLFHQPLSEYIPFLTAGYLSWLMLTATLSESCNIFVDAAPYITEIKLPFMLYIFKLTWRQIIIFAHNAVVFIIVALIFHQPFTWNLLFFIPGFVLFLLNLTAFSLLFAMLGTKFRDIQQAITSLLQIIFFITPISWSPSLMHNSYVIRLNPLTYFIDLVRSPLLGNAPQLTSWIVSSLISLIVFTLGFKIFSKYRRHIPFWL